MEFFLLDLSVEKCDAIRIGIFDNKITRIIEIYNIISY